ncbi:MAG TPA: hypothetical protein VF169_08845 [Albitalea sp.]
MHEAARDGHRRQQADEEVVAPIAGPVERDGEADSRRQGEGDVDGSSRPPERRQHRQAAGEPERGQAGQERPCRRGLVRPVAAGGEEKAHDHGQREAEEHLVRMPQRTSQVDVAEPPGKLQRPQRNRQRREDAGEKVERPEAQLPQRKPSGLRDRRLFNDVHLTRVEA